MATTAAPPGDGIAAPSPRRRGPGSPGRAPALGALVALSLLVVIPLGWMALTSLKTTDDAVRLPLSWLPRDWTVGGYRELLTTSAQTPVFRWLLNSVLAASGYTVLVLITASTAAYALARMDFAGKRALFAFVVSTLFIPGFVFLIPNFLIMDRLGWLDSLWPLIVPGAAGAFGVFFLRQFFLSLPAELEEAALLDGANRWQIFMRIVLPLSKAPLATLAVLSFLANWNDFLWPVYVTFSADSYTLPVGLSILQGAYTRNYPVIMAGAVLAAVPVLILFALAQRWIIEGVSRSGLKG